MTPRNSRALLPVLVALTATFSPGLTVREEAQQATPPISAEALAQIDALVREKETRTPTQQKMDSQLVYELKMAQGLAVAPGVPTVQTDLEYTTDARVVVDVTGSVGDFLLQQLTAIGAEVLSSGESSVRVAVDLSLVEAIAALPEVTFVQPKQNATTSRVGATPTLEQRRQQRRSRLRTQLASYLNSSAGETSPLETAVGTGVGSQSSKGDVTHRAFAARGAFGINGTGVRIGVISDGVTNLAASQALGDLGAVTVLAGQAGAGDEGTAMLEIVHDVAPGAQLFFATALGSIANFANNIRGLRNAGCDIIVDDIFYFVETPFQDGQAPTVISNTNGGVVIQAVNDVTASGALYFSSAGNSGNKNDNQSGVWEGDFVGGGATGAPLPAGTLHNFGGGQTFDTLTAASSSGAPTNLYWSDPLGGSANDYDLFRLNAAGTIILAASANIQNGTQDPYEQIASGTAGNRIVIVKKAGGQDRFLHLNTNRGRLSINTTGTTHGHSAAGEAYSVAATPASGPFPSGFTSANVVETFSSDGPRRMFYQANGTPFTANVSSTGGILRQKPDITAADGVSVTGVGGFPSPFFGTSAAAPHAAAIAALLKSANVSLTPAQIRNALTSTSIDIEAPGVDRDSGAGIIMPVAALQSTGAQGTAFFTLIATATENPGNGNGAINAGEGAKLGITLENVGVAAAADISGLLATATPGVTLTQPAASGFPDIPQNGFGTNATPYLFTLAWGVPCPLNVGFTLNLTWSTGSQSIPLQVATGPGPISITSTLDAIAPTPGPGFTGTTGVQGVRVFRDGIASTCAAPKAAFPGTTQPGTRQFDAYTFNACAEALPSCATVTLSGTNAINLFTAAYSPTFNPANIGENYLADAGASAASRTYSFNVGAAPFVVNIHDVPPGPPSNSTYKLSVSGICAGACATPNQVPVAKAKNVTVIADATCTAAASINDGSFDPDGDPITITQSPAGPYPIGTTTVILTVTDPKGASAQATATVTVEDKTPPAVTAVSVEPGSMWPPNHQMVDVTVNYNVADSCAASRCVLTVSSNEPVNGEGDGDTGPDWVIVDAHHVQLRAERSGKGSGRIYTITITCTDAYGNATVETATVLVPKNHQQ